MTTSQTSATLGTAATSSSAAARPLRLFLGLDAAVTAGNGLIYLIAAGRGDLLDMDAGLLRGIGVFLTVYGVLVGVLAAQQVPSAAATKIVIEANLLWAVASIATALFGWFDPNTIGTVWIPMQALVVGAFAVLQINGLRKLTN